MRKKQREKSGTQEPRSQCACIEFEHASAAEVCIAGVFNDWHPTATRMISLGEGKWAKEMTLPPGRYEYRLLVDGEWVDDPSAKETVANPFGGFNAVLTVEPG